MDEHELGGARRTRDARALDSLRVKPNARLVSLVTWACEAVREKIYDEKKYGQWLRWVESWQAGERRPRACTDVAHWCFSHRATAVLSDGILADYHALGQIAWAAKESCYDTPQSGWLVVRYIGDAMLAYGIAFPERLALPQIAPDSLDASAASHRPTVPTKSPDAAARGVGGG